VYYAPSTNFTRILMNRDLAINEPAINDLTSGPDGKLYLATDQGIYIWLDGRVYRYLDRFSGIGTSSVVKTINRDSSNRVWFSTPDDVGYYIDRSESQTPMLIQMVTPTTLPPLNTSGINSISGINQTPPTSPVTTMPAVTPAPTPKVPGSFLDQLIQSIRSFFTSIGMKPRF
jgi:hypothetical protein